MGCCGQAKPIVKSVAEMLVLKAASGFIPGQMYQIRDAHAARTANSVTLVACSGVAHVAESYPFTITGNISGVTASVTAGLAPATLTSVGGAFIEGETVHSSQSNCYKISGLTLSKGAVLNIRAYSTSELEDVGFGTFKNTVMGSSIYATMWYSLLDNTIYRIIDRLNTISSTGRSDIEDVLTVTTYVDSVIFDHLTYINNREKWQLVASKGPVLGSALASTTIIQSHASYGNGISLDNCIPAHFVVKWVAGTFGAVTVSFKVNGVTVVSGASLVGLDASNDILIPISAVSKMSISSGSLIEVQVTATVASTQFLVECYGIKVR